MQAKYAFKGLLLNCPDIMFNVIEDPLIFKDDFTSLAKKFNVYAVNLWSNYNFIYNTTDIQRKCEKTIGLILSPACIEVCNEIFWILRRSRYVVGYLYGIGYGQSEFIDRVVTHQHLDGALYKFNPIFLFGKQQKHLGNS